MRQSRLAVALTIVAGMVVGLMFASLRTNTSTASETDYDNMTPVIMLPTEVVPTQGPAPSYPSANRAPVLYADDFNQESTPSTLEIVELDGDIPSGDTSNWVLRDGTIYQQGIGPAHTSEFVRSAAITGDSRWTNYTVHAKGYTTYGLVMGLVFRYQDRDNYYRVWLDQSQLVLEKVVDGKVTKLSVVDTVSIKPHTWTILEVQAKGSDITVTIDGVPSIVTNDTTFSAGKAGLLALSMGGLTYDDLLVTAN